MSCVRRVLSVLLLSAVAAVFAAGCSKPSATTTTPPTTTRAVVVPDGWTSHSFEKFAIAVPDDWESIEVTPQLIDAMVEKLGEANPDIVSQLKAIRNQDSVKFWAMDLTLQPSGSAANVIVTEDIRIMSVDRYESVVKKRYGSIGYTFLSSEKSTLNGDETLLMKTESSVNYPDGTTATINQCMYVVDHGGYDYGVTLTFAKEDSAKYWAFFDRMIQTLVLK